ncbi:MAG: hypothetical protein WAT58_09705 [Candidatus Dormiibacterota bacterium]
MADIKRSVETYTQAWNTSDRDECVRLLNQSWVSHGEFLNAMLDAPLVGAEPLATYIDQTNAQFPGHRTVLAGEIVEHNSCALVSWRYVGPEGIVTLEGQNYVELDESGLIRRVVQFFPVTLAADS